MIVSTGLRWGEVAALRPEDVDLSRRVINITREWKHSESKGWYIGQPKSVRGTRTIPLPDDVLPTIKRRIVAGGDWLFTNRQGGPCDSRGSTRATGSPPDAWRTA
jgi:integrase